jgi:hypothetical protein
MPIKQQDKRDTGREDEGHRQRSALIGGHVLRALGQPGALHRVQVRQLWEDHYRVNVLVGPDAASARVAHSYFLVVDPAGAILAATPKITREY